MVTGAKKKVVKYKSKYYAEAFQSINTRFSFVTEKDGVYTELFYPVKCRDFLGDCIYSKKRGEKISIYSFSFSFKETPFDEDKTKLSLTFPDDLSMENFKTNFCTLNPIEKKYEIEPSIWYETNHKDTLIIEAPKIWQSNIWKISLLTFYLKLLCYKTRKDVQYPEKDYLTLFSIENEEKLLKNIRLEGEILHEGVMMVHNYSGFFTILQNRWNKKMTKLLLGEQYAL